MLPDENPDETVQLTDKMVTLISELDRGVRNSDGAITPWYEDWLKRTEQALGLEAGELNTSIG